MALHDRKLKMMAWCDSPLSITGFGVVAKNLLKRIHDSGMFDLFCMGINHWDEHVEHAFEDRGDVPYRVYMGLDTVHDRASGTVAIKDRMARSKTIEFLNRTKPDVVFLMRDLWDMVQPGENFSTYFPLKLQLAKEQGHNFRIVTHFPLEYKIQPQWKPILDVMDYGYCFTQGGMEQLAPWSNNIKWCPQGADPAVFHPVPQFNRKRFREERMRIPADSFVIVNVNRNQPRKDIASSIQAFAQFKHQVQQSGGPRPILWMHMRPDDDFGDARKLVEKFGLRTDHDVCFPPYFNVGSGWSDADLNHLYNASDLYISTSVAEGWGLTPVEAGMAGCPVLVPGHTGFLSTMGHLGMPYIKTLRPEIRENVGPSEITPTDVNDLATQMVAHYADPSLLKNSVRKHLKDFTNRFSWDTIFKDYWMPLLQTVREDILNTPARQQANAGRTLFVCEEAFGDVLGASKALASLRVARPDSKLDFMTKPQFQDVLVGNPNLDKIIPWDLNKIYDYGQDRVFYPHARIRHGSWSNGHSHLMDMQAEMIGLRPGAVYLKSEPFDLHLDGIFSPEDVNSDTTLPLITINTTSQGGKMISLEKWATLISGIYRQNPHVRFALVGGGGDMVPVGCLDFRFEPGSDRVLSFRKMAYLQSRAICHLGIDSGPGHSADAVGTPSIIFWGWTSVGVCKPQYYSINIVPHFPTVCPSLGPCHSVNPTCGINRFDTASSMKAPCIQSIDVSPAIHLVNEALGMGLDTGKDWLKQRASKLRPIYALPTRPQARQEVPA